jgi:hypothetical protein
MKTENPEFEIWPAGQKQSDRYNQGMILGFAAFVLTAGYLIFIAPRLSTTGNICCAFPLLALWAWACIRWKAHGRLRCPNCSRYFSTSDEGIAEQKRVTLHCPQCSITWLTEWTDDSTS